MLGLSTSQLGLSKHAAQGFRLLVPRPYLNRITPGDANDPLLRQVLPVDEETYAQSGFVKDAVGDLDSAGAEGVLQKYHGRALLMTTGACAIHCRYCFRRHFPYHSLNAGRDNWQGALSRLRRDTTIREVILRGGDPLSLSDRRLSALVAALDEIGHLDTLRIHTRLPIVIPARINDTLLAWLGRTRLKTVMVIHANHANELDTEVGRSLARVRPLGTMLLNQAVLLRGVNDNVEALEALSRRLFEMSVLPYYLHLLDRVFGTAHFEVKEADARRLMADLSARVPGYLLPRLAREESGKPSKTQLS
jgi:EF-P beta-lysylation protein EpmB